jgi:hypothetical protein
MSNVVKALLISVGTVLSFVIICFVVTVYPAEVSVPFILFLAMLVLFFGILFILKNKY